MLSLHKNKIRHKYFHLYAKLDLFQQHKNRNVSMYKLFIYRLDIRYFY